MDELDDSFVVRFTALLRRPVPDDLAPEQFSRMIAGEEKRLVNAGTSKHSVKYILS